MFNKFRSHIIFCAIVCGLLTFSRPSQATVYYVSDCQTGAVGGCIAGSDAANGTSASTPWLSLAKAATVVNTMAAGSSILFARGSSLASSAGITIANFNSVASNPIILGDYGPSWYAGIQKPILTLTAVTTVYLFNFADGGNADHDEGYILQNLDLRGSGFGNAVFFFNDVDHATFTNLAISGFSIGVQGGGSSAPNAGSDATNQYITLSNSSIINNSDQGFLGYANDLLIADNTFDNNGFASPLLDHNLYIGATHDTVNINGIVIRNNILTHAALSAGKCAGNSMVMHGNHQASIIENNTVQEDLGGVQGGCYGIAVDPGYSSPEGFFGTIIRGNKIINVGYIGIGVTSCPNCLITNNTIIQNQTGIPFTGISVPDRARGPEDILDNAATVTNNSIFIGSNVTTFVGISVGTEGTGHTISSNAVYYAGTTNGNTCIAHPLSGGSYTSLAYNVCYCPTATCN